MKVTIVSVVVLISSSPDVVNLITFLFIQEKLPKNPIILIVPQLPQLDHNLPPNKGKRSKLWNNQLANMAKIKHIPPPNIGKITDYWECFDEMVVAVKAAILEVHIHLQLLSIFLCGKMYVTSIYSCVKHVVLQPEMAWLVWKSDEIATVSEESAHFNGYDISCFNLERMWQILIMWPTNFLVSGAFTSAIPTPSLFIYYMCIQNSIDFVECLKMRLTWKVKFDDNFNERR